MRIKSYFADSVQEAIEKARIELGTDAMLMNSKKTDFDLLPLGAYEVVFGVPTAGTIQKPVSINVKAGPVAIVGGTDGLVKELADLRRQIETVTRTVTRQQRSTPVTETGLAASAGVSSRDGEVCARLLAADFSEELAQEIAEEVEALTAASHQPGNRVRRDYDTIHAEALESTLFSELERRVHTSPGLGVSGSKSRVVLFVGPSGSGKTTSLIKLGLRYGLQTRTPMHILSLDTLRVGGWEQLASYARIAGLGFDAVHNLRALDQALVEHQDKKLVLIDTPGFAPADVEDMSELATWAANSPNLDVQLVLPATLRVSVARRALERFAQFQPSKLLLTHIDDAESVGPILELAIRSGLPLSYLSNGQQIPEDIKEASKAELLASFSVRQQLAIASAA